MPIGDGHQRSDLSPTQRARIWRTGLSSSLRRYVKDLAPQRANHAHHAHDGTLAERWAAVPASPGVSALCWLGHCSVLLKVNGVTVLTDPVLARKIGLRLGLLTIGPRRLAPIPVSAGAMPRADLLLLSHAHYDHLDKPTLRALANPHTRVVTAANTARLIPRGFGDVVELPWDSTLDVAGLRLAAVRPRHWGARTAWDRHRGFNAYLIQAAADAQAPRVLFAGDTAFTTNFDVHAPVDLAIFGIGAYNPWHHAHATPEQVWEMATALNARRILPVHHSTFKLSDEPIDEPMRRLLAAAEPRPASIIHAQPGDVVPLD